MHCVCTYRLGPCKYPLCNGNARWVNCEACGGSGEIVRRDPVRDYEDPSAAEYAEICAACEGTGRDCEIV